MITTLIIIPAVDIKSGRCVRLHKGEFDTVHEVAPSPIRAAKGFEADGAEWLHMVDLDGSLQKKPVNHEVVRQVLSETSLKVEIGGGVRDMGSLAFYINIGVSRVILGSAALSDETFLKEAVTEFGERIAVGIDAKNGMVAVNGWKESTGVGYLELAKRVSEVGVKTIIYTDIGRDGTLTGLNLEELKAVNEATQSSVIASGGVRNIEDLRAAKALGLYGAICGKSLYSGTLKLKEAISEG